MPLARSSVVRHKASGTSLHTPLLVPSFSSKGFAVDANGRSEVLRVLETASEFLADVYLISAFDLHYGHLPAPGELPAKAALTFVDSGGYEISPDRDLSAVVEPRPSDQEWSMILLKSVLDHWPRELPAAFVSYDHHRERRCFAEQLDAARGLFASYPDSLSDFLLKPETADQRTLKSTLPAAIANIGSLAAFDIIGVTEKELGSSNLERMVQLAKLRRALDEAGLRLPIHVFGALDPLSTCLYFLAGAEVFDGLTWIRYGYSGGQCVYAQNLGALEYGLHVPDNQVRARALSNNYYYLDTLQSRLRDFCATGDFNKLAPHAQFLQQAADTLETRLRGGR